MFNKIKGALNMGDKYNCGTCHENFATRKMLDDHKASAHPGVERAGWEKSSDK